MAHPKTLGACADRLYKLRAERLKIESKAKAIRSQEAELHDHIRALLSKQRLDKASGKLATVSKTSKPVGRIQDWPAVVKFAAENDASDLIERRVAGKALAERIENGQDVDGVVLEHVAGLSITKR